VREPNWLAFWLQKPSILRACVREEDAGGREAGAHSTTPTYTVRMDCPAREPSWLAFWLQKPSILRACVREEDAGGSEAGVPLDLKMQLENGRAEERVSRGQASNRAVCVCEEVSVEMGARRPPLPTAVVCPPGRRRRRHLAITAVCLLRLLRLLVKNERDLFFPRPHKSQSCINVVRVLRRLRRF
jgi:hypothetical protein